MRTFLAKTRTLALNKERKVDSRHGIKIAAYTLYEKNFNAANCFNWVYGLIRATGTCAVGLNVCRGQLHSGAGYKGQLNFCGDQWWHFSLHK